MESQTGRDTCFNVDGRTWASVHQAVHIAVYVVGRRVLKQRNYIAAIPRVLENFGVCHVRFHTEANGVIILRKVDMSAFRSQ